MRSRDVWISIRNIFFINNELERLILGYGGHAEVIAPPEFRKRMAESTLKAASRYHPSDDS